MFTVEISKAMIAHEICGELCMIAESCQDGPVDRDSTVVLVKDFDNGKPLHAKWSTVMAGYHAYSGDVPEKTRIPEFISKDWDRAFKIFKKLKGFQ
tara:strand:- start:653 stop:940 length:288 start_codon:yes stop_codon:yes gene_type:complete